MFIGLFGSLNGEGAEVLIVFDTKTVANSKKARKAGNSRNLNEVLIFSIGYLKF
jgi:hypothetical protein